MTTLRVALNRIWASSPTAAKTPISDAKYDLGWVAEIPTFQNLNWLHNKLDNNQLSLAERGVFEWGSDVVYKKGALVWRETDGYIYVSLVDATTEAPSATALTWKRSAAQLSRVEYDALVAAWDEHRTNVLNPHGTTAAQLNAFTKEEIDLKIAILQGNLDAHTNSLLNPHETNALQVGAVPSTGGEYTGEVQFPSIAIKTDGRITADSTKLEITFKGSAVGIDALGKPFSRRGGVTSTLLLETDYQNQRLINEPLFGVPLPSFSMAMQAHLYPSDGGMGVEVQYTRPNILGYTDKFGDPQVAAIDTPAFQRDGLFTGTTDTMRIMNLAFPSNKLFTVAVRTYTEDPTASVVNTQILGITSYWSLDYLGTTVKLTVGANSQSFPRSLKKDSVLVVVSTASVFYLYQDGVLLGSVTRTAGLPNTGGLGFDATGSKTINSLKMWHVQLSAQQVSTL